MCGGSSDQLSVHLGELVPYAHLIERPVVTALVFLGGTLGTVLLGLVASALLPTPSEPPDVNLGGPTILAILLYAIALLTGELVLAGRLAPAR